MNTKYSISETLFVSESKAIFSTLRSFLMEEARIIEQIRIKSLLLTWPNLHYDAKKELRRNRAIVCVINNLSVFHLIYTSLCNGLFNRLFLVQRCVSLYALIDRFILISLSLWNTLRSIRTKRSLEEQNVLLGMFPVVSKLQIQRILKSAVLLIVPVVIYKINTQTVLESYASQKGRFDTYTRKLNTPLTKEETTKHLKAVMYRTPQSWSKAYRLVTKQCLGSQQCQNQLSGLIYPIDWTRSLGMAAPVPVNTPCEPPTWSEGSVKTLSGNEPLDKLEGLSWEMQLGSTSLQHKALLHTAGKENSVLTTCRSLWSTLANVDFTNRLVADLYLKCIWLKPYKRDSLALFKRKWTDTSTPYKVSKVCNLFQSLRLFAQIDLDSKWNVIPTHSHPTFPLSVQALERKHKQYIVPTFVYRWYRNTIRTAVDQPLNAIVNVCTRESLINQANRVNQFHYVNGLRCKQWWIQLQEWTQENSLLINKLLQKGHQYNLVPFHLWEWLSKIKPVIERKGLHNYVINAKQSVLFDQRRIKWQTLLQHWQNTFLLHNDYTIHRVPNDLLQDNRLVHPPLSVNRLENGFQSIQQNNKDYGWGSVEESKNLLKTRVCHWPPLQSSSLFVIRNSFAQLGKHLYRYLFPESTVSFRLALTNAHQGNVTQRVDFNAWSPLFCWSQLDRHVSQSRGDKVDNCMLPKGLNTPYPRFPAPSQFQYNSSSNESSTWGVNNTGFDKDPLLRVQAMNPHGLFVPRILPLIRYMPKWSSLLIPQQKFSTQLVDTTQASSYSTSLSPFQLIKCSKAALLFDKRVYSRCFKAQWDTMEQLDYKLGVLKERLGTERNLFTSAKRNSVVKDTKTLFNLGRDNSDWGYASGSLPDPYTKHSTLIVPCNLASKAFSTATNKELEWDKTVPLSEDQATLLSGSQDRDYQSSIQVALRHQRPNEINRYCVSDVEHTLHNYTPWLLTSQWWWWLQKGSVYTTRIVWRNFCDNLQSFGLPALQHLLPSIHYQRLIPSFSLRDCLLSKDSLQKTISFLWQQVSQTQRNERNLWKSVHIAQQLAASESVAIAWLGVIGALSLHCISTCIGLSYLYLWNQYQRIHLVFDPTWHTQLDIDAYKRGWQADTFGSQLLSLRLLVYSRWIGRTIINIWLLNTFTLDVFSRQKDVVEQSFISLRSLLQDNLYKDPSIQWASSLKRDFHTNTNYLRLLASVLSSSAREMFTSKGVPSISKSVFYAFYAPNRGKHNTLFSYPEQVAQGNLFKPLQEDFSVPVELECLPPKGILLVGPKDAGKSYLVKSLAADTRMSVVQVSISKLLSKKIGTENVIDAQPKVKQLLKQRLALLCDLAAIASPCIVWIPSIHTFCKDTVFEGKKLDLFFLFRSLLKTISSYSYKYSQKRVLFVASTDNVKQLDPAAVSIRGFHRLLNVRMLAGKQRTQQLLAYLLAEDVVVREPLWKFDIDNQTMGYTHIDLKGLVNESLLTSITQRRREVNASTVQLSLYRQTFGIDNTSVLPYSDIVPYRIGKNIIHRILVDTHDRIDVQLHNNLLWKTRFYFLSKAYIEPYATNSSVAEFVVLPYICEYLSGCATRDVWLFSLGRISNCMLSLNKQITHDLKIAFGLFEGLLIKLVSPDMLSKSSSTPFNASGFQSMYSLGALSIVEAKVQQRAYAFSKKEKVGTSFMLSDNTRELTLRKLQASPVRWSQRAQRVDLYGSSVFKNGDSSPRNSISLSVFHSRDEQQAAAKRASITLSGPYERPILQQTAAMSATLSYPSFVNKNTKQSNLSKVRTFNMEDNTLHEPLVFMSGRFVWDPPTLFGFEDTSLNRQDLNLTKNILNVLLTTNRLHRSHLPFSSKSIKPRFRKRDLISRLENSMDDSTKMVNKLNSSSKQKSKGRKQKWFQQLNIQHFSFLKQRAQMYSEWKAYQLHLPLYYYHQWIIDTFNYALYSQCSTNSAYKYERHYRRTALDGTKEIQMVFSEIYRYILELLTTRVME